MAGALGLVLTTDVAIGGQHAQPIYIDESLPIVGPSRACVLISSTGNDTPLMGGPPIASRLAPAGTPAVGPAIPVYVVPGGGVLDVLGYTKKIQALGPIAYWPMAELSGAVAQDESGNSRPGAYTSVTLGQAGIGDGRTSPGFDGTNSYNNVFTASLQAAFNGQLGSFSMWGKVSAAGVWTDGITRRMILFQVDASNRVGIFKPVANNEIDCLYVAGGTSLGAAKTTFSPTGWFHVALTWSKAADQMIFYVNGVAITPISTGLGTFAGAISATQTIIGSLNTGAAAQVWSGNLAHAAVFNRVLSASEVLVAATVP